jgi:Flp pilus assembly pilin Flp
MRKATFRQPLSSRTRRCRAVAALLDDSGQDVIEYALLGAIVGIASIATWKLFATTVGNVYSAADTDVQNVSACTPNPGGGGCS